MKKTNSQKKQSIKGRKKTYKQTNHLSQTERKQTNSARKDTKQTKLGRKKTNKQS